MLITDLPLKFTIPFANSAGAGFINTIPTSPSPTPGLASLTTGFPTLTFQPEASGGQPPYGADFNGILNWITAWNRWQSAGGSVSFDTAFAAAIGGYPKGAALLASSIGNGRFWLNNADGNTSNPDGTPTGGTNWLAFPDLPIQLQRPNFGADSGSANAIAVTLFPAPASWAQIVGAPIRVGSVVATNSVNNPTIKINGLTPATIVNPDGSVLALGQIPAGCTISGVPRADGTFQLDSPAKVAAAATFPFAGTIMLWPNETAPSGWLEMNGAVLLMATYPNLFNVLQTRYGGDGVTTFALPDWRGQFPRIWDHGRGLDPNAGTRGNAGGGITGDHVGTVQGGAVGPFTLTNQPFTLDNLLAFASGMPGGGSWVGVENNVSLSGYNSETNPQQAMNGGGINTVGYYSKIKGTTTLTANPNLETRPTNIYAMAIIKT